MAMSLRLGVLQILPSPYVDCDILEDIIACCEEHEGSTSTKGHKGYSSEHATVFSTPLEYVASAFSKRRREPSANNKFKSII